MTAFCSTCYLLRGGDITARIEMGNCDNCGRLMPLRKIKDRPELPGQEAMEL